MDTPAGQKNIGTADAPLFVPIGSPADVNYTQNIAPTQNQTGMTPTNTQLVAPPAVITSEAARTTTQDNLNKLSAFQEQYGGAQAFQFMSGTGFDAQGNPVDPNAPKPATTPTPSSAATTTPAPSATATPDPNTPTVPTGVNTPAGTTTPSSTDTKATPQPGTTDYYKAQLESTNTQIDNETNSYISLLNSQIAKVDARVASQIKSITDSFERQKEQTKLVNAAVLGNLTMAGIRSGRQRYATEIQSSILSNEQRNGIQRLADLDRQEQEAIQTAQNAADDKDFELLDKQMTAIANARKEKNATLTALMNASQQQEQLLLQKQQQAHTEQQDLIKQFQDAQTFAYDHGITSKYYTMSSGPNAVVIDTQTGMPINEKDFFAKEGFKSWDEVPKGMVSVVKRPSGMTKDTIFGSAEGGYYDISTGVPKLIVPGTFGVKPEKIGESVNAYGEKVDVYGTYNSKTGRYEPIDNVGGQAAASGLNSVDKYADGTNGGECGDFVKTMIQLPTPGGRVGMEWSEKQQFVDKYGMRTDEWLKNGPQVGDAVYVDTGKRYGHVAAFISDNGDTITVKDSNWVGADTIGTHEIPKSQVYGAIRGTLKSDAAAAVGSGTAPSVQRNSKMDTIVSDIIKSNAQWGTAADAIDARFGKGTATAYDAELKSKYLLPQRAAEAGNDLYNPSPELRQQMIDTGITDWQGNFTQFGWRKLRAQFIADNNYTTADEAGKIFDSVIAKPNADNTDSSQAP